MPVQNVTVRWVGGGGNPSPGPGDMLSQDDFDYALENTRVIVPPRHRIETFGTSVVNYYLVTEEMDAANLSRVREGQIHAERPQIITPSHMARLLLEGFGEEAREYADSVAGRLRNLAILKYGFRFRKADARTYDVAEPIGKTIENVKRRVAAKDDPLSTVLAGVDDGWEVCLLRFMIDLIAAFAQGNLEDFRGRGLI